MLTVQRGTALSLEELHSGRMNEKSLMAKRFLAVACPTCGVGLRMGCIGYSGVARSESHVGRELAAIEAAERKCVSTA
jgi:hypothetical protein